MQKTQARELRTVSSELEQDYYGVPPIKAPHWNWLIITYFFTGGLAAGSYIIATLADLLSKDKGLVRAGRYLSLVTGVISPVLLMLDLGRPDRAHHMFRIVKLKSPMSLGSWALLMLGFFVGPMTALQVLEDVTQRDVFSAPRKVIGVLGIPASLFVSGYTGVLVGATNVPLWARNAVLWGPTFVASAFSTSLAAISLILRVSRHEQRETADALRHAEAITLATEMGLMLMSLVRLGKFREPLTGGRWGKFFWPGYVGGGMVAPLALQIGSSKSHHQRTVGRRMAGAALALAGGFIFRMVVVQAGKDSANNPRFYFDYTRRPDGARNSR